MHFLLPDVKMQSIHLVCNLYFPDSVLLFFEVVSSSYKSSKLKERGGKENVSCK